MTVYIDVFGTRVAEGTTVDVFFNEKGRIIPDATGSVAHLAFEVDEDREPLARVITGAENFDGESLLYFGGLTPSETHAFEGLATIGKTHRLEDDGESYIFAITNRRVTFEDRELHDEYLRAGGLPPYHDRDDVD
jgi:hypothetical protein